MRSYLLIILLFNLLFSVTLRPENNSEISYTHVLFEWDQIYNATNYVDWPESLVIQDSQKPFRGGYLREKITAFIPKVGT